MRCGFTRSYPVTTPRTCRLASVSVDTSAFRAGHMLAAACSCRGQHLDRKALGHRLPGVPPTSRDDRRRISKHPSRLTFFRNCISQEPTPPMRRALVPTSTRDRLAALLHALVAMPRARVRRCRRPELGSWKGWRCKRFSGPSLFCFVACSGYLPALAQAALLEIYSGPNVAVEAASLADAVRARCGTAASNQHRLHDPRRPRRPRRRRRARARTWKAVPSNTPHAPHAAEPYKQRLWPALLADARAIQASPRPLTAAAFAKTFELVRYFFPLLTLTFGFREHRCC